MILDHKSSFKICFMQHNLHQHQTINTWIWYTQELLTWETFAIGHGQAYMTLIMTLQMIMSPISEIDSRDIIWIEPNNQTRIFNQRADDF